MYQALYRIYRPEVFDEMLGQEHIVRILKHQLESDKVGHAYLLCGTRGTGKTTTARILAKGVNCLSEGERPCGECANCQAIKEGSFMDVIEIDAASNNGVDNIRELRESVKYPPAVGRKKVYIIDEVHMLSPGAFNALLKTLEEPPEYVMFILATTEPQKLPATILSRCMRLDFRRVPERTLKDGMRMICEEKGINASDAALGIIASNADGSVRDGLSLLDQCIASGQKNLERDDVLELLGLPSEEAFIELTHNVSVHNTSEALMMLEKLISEGKEIRQIMKEWLAHYRALLISKFISSPEDMLNMSTENIERLRDQSDTLDVSEINICIMELSKAISDAKWSTQPRILLELAIVKMSSIYEEMVVQKVAKPAPRKKEMQTPKKQAKENIQGVEAEASRIDTDLLWRSLIENASKEKPALSMMSSGARIERVSGDVLIINSNSQMTHDIMEESIDILERNASMVAGQRLKVRLIGEEGETVENTSNVDEVAREAEKLLGIDIEIV